MNEQNNLSKGLDCFIRTFYITSLKMKVHTISFWEITFRHFPRNLQLSDAYNLFIIHRSMYEWSKPEVASGPLYLRMPKGR